MTTFIRMESLLHFFRFPILMNLFRTQFCFRSQPIFQVLTAGGQQMDITCGDAVYVVDTTPYHVIRVVPSTSSLMTHPAFDSPRLSFFSVSQRFVLLQNQRSPLLSTETQS